ncbi:MAG: CPBP family intramembrane glutamic endopeptidase [Gemmatimonadota bacterium]
MGLSWIGWGHLGVLTLVLPALALVQPAIPEPLPPRRTMYLSASTVLWILAVVTVGVLLWEGVAPHHLRLYGRGSVLETLAWSAGTCAAAVATAAGVTLAGRRLGFRESVWVTHLMPRDRADRAAFVGVAFTAGITEELLYRGFALWALATACGDRPWLAAALLGLPFGILHAYQGVLGMVRAGLLGVLLAVPVLAGGGLVAAVLAHAGVDLALGLGWRRLLHEPAAGERGEPEEGAEAEHVGDRGEDDRRRLGGVEPE